MKITGWPLDVIDAAPAAVLDHLIAMDDVSAEATERQAKAQIAKAKK